MKKQLFKIVNQTATLYVVLITTNGTNVTFAKLFNSQFEFIKFQVMTGEEQKLQFVENCKKLGEYDQYDGLKLLTSFVSKFGFTTDFTSTLVAEATEVDYLLDKLINVNSDCMPA
jgi:HKD family nuclease